MRVVVINSAKALLMVSLALAIAMMATGEASAAAVFACGKSGTRCVAKIDEGIVGDTVKVLDDKAHVAATGRIIKRKGGYVLIQLSKLFKKIRRGYPVLVSIEDRQSSVQWAATLTD